MVHTNILLDIDVGGSAAFPFGMGFAVCNPFLALRSMMSDFSTSIFFAQFSKLIGSLGVDFGGIRATTSFASWFDFARTRFLWLQLSS